MGRCMEARWLRGLARALHGPCSSVQRFVFWLKTEHLFNVCRKAVQLNGQYFMLGHVM